MEQVLHISGIIATGAVAILGFGKKLRSAKVLKILFLITAIVAVVGVALRNQVIEQRIGNPADSLFSPLTYIISYAGLRQIFKMIYKVEPTYQQYHWYDHEDGRKQNILDVVVHIFPLMVALFIPSIIQGIF